MRAEHSVSGNPAFSARAFEGLIRVENQMTITGTANKTGLLLIFVLLTAGWSWNRFFETGDMKTVIPFIGIGASVGFMVALITIFRQNWAPITAPVYALLEGLALGGASALFEIRFPGIAIQAVGLTFGTLIGLLLA